MSGKTRWLLLCLCVLLLSGCLRRRLTAAEVVRNAQEALAESGARHFLLDVEVETEMFGDSLTIEVWEAPPERLKIRVLSARNPQLQQLAFSTDGQRSISYSPQSNQVVTGPADVVKMHAIIEGLVSATRDWLQSGDPNEATVLSRERERGLVVYKIGMPLAQDGRAQFWIDARRWHIARIVYEAEHLGKGTIQVRDAQQFEDLPASAFELDIPQGAVRTELQQEDNRPITLDEAQRMVDFPLHTPGYIPEGTHLAETYQVDKNIAMVYSGSQPFTLVQGPNVPDSAQAEGTLIPLRGQQARLLRDQQEAGLVLVWREDELQFSLSGQLSEQELVRIAESLRPGL